MLHRQPELESRASTATVYLSHRWRKNHPKSTNLSIDSKGMRLIIVLPMALTGLITSLLPALSKPVISETRLSSDYVTARPIPNTNQELLNRRTEDSEKMPSKTSPQVIRRAWVLAEYNKRLKGKDSVKSQLRQLDDTLSFSKNALANMLVRLGDDDNRRRLEVNSAMGIGINERERWLVDGFAREQETFRNELAKYNELRKIVNQWLEIMPKKGQLYQELLQFSKKWQREGVDFPKGIL